MTNRTSPRLNQAFVVSSHDWPGPSKLLTISAAPTDLVSVGAVTNPLHYKAASTMAHHRPCVGGSMTVRLKTFDERL